MAQCRKLFLVCTISWTVAMSAEGHVESPAFKYSKQANEAAQRYTAEPHAPHTENQDGGGFSHADHHSEPEHHHGHSHGNYDGDAHHRHQKMHGGPHAHSHGENQQRISAQQKSETPLSITTLWTQAIGATLLVSVAPFLILVFIPISGRTGHEDFLKTLLSFASGGLLGDAFLHLIPHAMNPHDHHRHSNSDGSHHQHLFSGEHVHAHDNSVGLCVLMGILAFLIVEKFVRMVKGNHSHDSHGHLDETAFSVPAEDSAVEKTKVFMEPKESKVLKKNLRKVTAAGGDKKMQEEQTDFDLRKQHDDVSTAVQSEIRVAAYLNLAADFAHNFTDGLAIGASFLAGNTAGIVSTVTILLHEVPHEIGDFAILVQSGMSKQKAMCMQLVTAIGCLSGTVVSLLAGGVGAAHWVLPFTAGGFIYIATVSVIPELLENSRFWQSVKEITALVLGVSMMMLLTEFEENV